MATKDLTSAFQAHLDELLLVVENAEYNTKLKKSLNSFLNWENMNGSDKAFIKDFFQLSATPVRPLCNAIYLSAVASFESFITETIEFVVEFANSKYKTYESLPEELKLKHIELSGRILSSIYSPPDHINIDFSRISRRVGTMYAGSASIEINPEIAGYVKKLLELEGFFDFIDKCRFKIDFDGLAKEKEIIEAFGNQKTRDTAHSIKKFLEELKKQRNRIAHTGQSSSDVTVEIVQTTFKKLRCIAQGINSIVLKQAV